MSEEYIKLYKDEGWLADKITKDVPEIIDSLGEAYNLPVIDVFTALGGATLR